MPAFVRRTTLLHAVIDRYFLPAGPTAANLQQRVCCCQPVLDGHTKGQTDGQTSYRFITLAPHTMRVMSITSIPCNDMIIISQHVHVNNSVQWHKRRRWEITSLFFTPIHCNEKAKYTRTPQSTHAYLLLSSLIGVSAWCESGKSLSTNKVVFGRFNRVFLFHRLFLNKNLSLSFSE